MSTLIADRFEVLDPDGPLGRDRVTGARVLLAESWPGRWRGPVGALDVATLRAMAERVARMNHPRVAQVLSVDPVVIEAGPERDSQPALSHDEWLRIADELASTIEELFAHGVSVDPMLAWVERTPEGQAHVRLPAPVHAWDVRARDLLDSVARWVEARAGSRKLGRKVTYRLAPRLAAAGDRRLTATMDFDLAIRLGEAELDKQLASPPGREDRLPFVRVPLAAAYHHRACVAWSRGDRDQAAGDLARAIELDAHARYLTTAALWAESGGDLDAAGEQHDRAVAASEAPVGWYGDDDGFGEERDAARTLTARAAFLARADTRRRSPIWRLRSHAGPPSARWRGSRRCAASSAIARAPSRRPTERSRSTPRARRRRACARWRDQERARPRRAKRQEHRHGEGA